MADVQINLGIASIRERIAETFLADIDKASVELAERRHSRRLPASLLGKKCSRMLWYVFRWAKMEHAEAKTLRIFNRGNREEARLWELLIQMGCKLHSTTKEKQFEVNAVNGHCGGYVDNIITLPENYHISDRILLEAKTMKQDNKWTKLKQLGVQEIKPEYYAQTCVYGAMAETPYCLFIAVNKNTDDIHVELIELDLDYGNELLRKAHEIVYTPTSLPPAKISNNPTNYACKWCNFLQICHYQEQVEKNCRSCQYASPGPDGAWHCEKFQDIIPPDYIAEGCDNWLPIT